MDCEILQLKKVETISSLHAVHQITEIELEINTVRIPPTNQRRRRTHSHVMTMPPQMVESTVSLASLALFNSFAVRQLVACGTCRGWGACRSAEQKRGDDDD
jgi:hypothetical protein